MTTLNERTNENLNSVKATKKKYIGVWFLWITLSTVFGFAIIFLLSFFNFYQECSYPHQVFSIIIIYTTGAFSFCAVYQYFRNLIISKVMIYVWLLGLVGAGSINTDTQNTLKNCSIEYERGEIAIIIMACYIIHNLLITFYFRGKPQWKDKK